MACSLSCKACAVKACLELKRSFSRDTKCFCTKMLHDYKYGLYQDISEYIYKTVTFIFPKLNFNDDYFLNYSKNSVFQFSNKFN